MYNYYISDSKIDKCEENLKSKFLPKKTTTSFIHFTVVPWAYSEKDKSMAMLGRAMNFKSFVTQFLKNKLNYGFVIKFTKSPCKYLVKFWCYLNCKALNSGHFETICVTIVIPETKKYQKSVTRRSSLTAVQTDVYTYKWMFKLISCFRIYLAYFEVMFVYC